MPAAGLPDGLVAPPADARLTVTFHDDTGRERRLADLDAALVVVNFWATWCAPCIVELPTLGALQAAVREADVRVLAVSVDRAGIPRTRRFFERHDRPDISFGHDPRGRNLERLEIEGLPTTIVATPDGRVLAWAFTAIDWAEPEIVAWLRARAESLPPAPASGTAG